MRKTYDHASPIRTTYQRMNLTSWRYIGVAAVMAVCFSVIGYQEHQRYSLTEGAAGRDAVALVTEVTWKERKLHKSNFVLSVEFETEDGELRNERIDVSNELGNRMRSVDEVEEIDIRYNNDNPSIAVIKGEKNSEFIQLWLAVASAAIALILLTWRLISQRRAEG
ncbi:hypothetical protein DBR33_02840 [Stenotrophomonas sp. HMWF022]|uniref:hypothetical protein n=1 Tax=Stenotrophomonas sp. HMWF023 TaxID=2056859 RepID=UPI000D3C95CE|nr:hypothetical protein [Stenotrophomonas sp. HMWF023]PTS73918.1 hypothetical protein DBR20_15075 [Stenotrophomonas sp. HMWF023]PTT56045.1 hypothetical protein DBR33_02840 [Stenotrophomonas sp. HMWF022]